MSKELFKEGKCNDQGVQGSSRVLKRDKLGLGESFLWPCSKLHGIYYNSNIFPQFIHKIRILVCMPILVIEV